MNQEFSNENILNEAFNNFFPLDNVRNLSNIRKLTLDPVVGYFTNRFPVEFLHALGFHPSRMVSDGTEDHGAKDEYIQTFSCSWLTSIFESHLRDKINYDALVFSTGTCDSLQNMSDIWIKALPDTKAYHFAFPVRTSGNLTNQYFNNELVSISKQICESLEIAYNYDQLPNSVKLFNKKRLLIQKVYEKLIDYQIPYNLLFKLLIIADLTTVEYSIQLFEAFLSDIDKAKYPLREKTSVKIAVIGSMFDNIGLFEKIPILNNSVVVDDLSYGTRNNFFIIEETNNPDDQLDLLVSAYLNKVPDSTIYDMSRRAEHLVNIVNNFKVKGVIMLLQKWCDPEGFEFVELQKKLKNINIPFTVIDVDSSLSNLGQLQTRVEAFIEMVGED